MEDMEFFHLCEGSTEGFFFFFKEMNICQQLKCLGFFFALATVIEVLQ